MARNLPSDAFEDKVWKALSVSGPTPAVVERIETRLLASVGYQSEAVRQRTTWASVSAMSRRRPWVMATSSTQWSSNRVKALEFGIDSPLEVDGRKLTSIDFSHHNDQDYADPYIDQKSGLTIGRHSLNPALIRNGRMTISTDTVVLELRGPWVLTWDVPREVR